jgi:hypothetical protein
MGLFDTFRFFGDDNLVITCPNGHRYEELQTKDLENIMMTYYIVDGHVYVSDYAGMAEYVKWDEGSDYGPMRLNHVTRTPLFPRDLEGEIEAHFTCDKCDHHYDSFALRFEKGVLASSVRRPEVAR